MVIPSFHYSTINSLRSLTCQWKFTIRFYFKRIYFIIFAFMPMRLPYRSVFGKSKFGKFLVNYHFFKATLIRYLISKSYSLIISAKDDIQFPIWIQCFFQHDLHLPILIGIFLLLTIAGFPNRIMFGIFNIRDFKIMFHFSRSK